MSSLINDLENRNGGIVSVDSSTGSKPAAGWYRNPSEPGVVRYWDGTGWTSSVRPDPAAVADLAQGDAKQNADAPSAVQASDGSAREKNPYRHWDGQRWWTWNGQAWEPEKTSAVAPAQSPKPDVSGTIGQSRPVIAPAFGTPTADVSAGAFRQIGKRRWIVAASIALLLVLGVIAVIAKTSGPTGYNDPVTLANSIQANANEKLAATGGGTIVEVTCIAAGVPHQFTCHATDSGGDTSVVTATVSADGSSWITGN